ncbi:MAG: hypothetical protein JEZ09_06610 [Salinivirgaceae bacterium]|nr:hypothetical protein [Salinivirgaceae bacterium]
MKNFFKIAPWMTILIYLGVILTLISAKSKEILCTQIKVDIQDETSNYFIEETDVLNMLNDRGEQLIGLPIEQINVNKLEEFLLLNPSVKNANVYRTYNGDVQISVTQRNPILRVINKSRESFYVDEEGSVMPLSNKYTAHVLVVSGDIDLSFTQLTSINQSHDNEEIVENSKRQLLDLYNLASYIYKNEFWRAQIEQIYIHGNEYELVPRVGTHVILLGDISDYEIKLKKLKALYQQGLPIVGWNKYDKINLKYFNQVICTKR